MFNFFKKNKLAKDKNEVKKVINNLDFWSHNPNEEVFTFKDFNLWSAGKTAHILKNINLVLKKNCVISIIGPSGSGKTSLLKCINKSILDQGIYETSGELIYKNINIFYKDFPIEALRTQIGLVFQKPIMFPMSIKENILFALKSHGILDHKYLNKKLELLLRNCFLWDELKDRLNDNPVNTLSGGQQQRLCIARALALQPEVILMDEPTSSLDPKSNSKIEELIIKISKTTTVIIVSHSLSQVRRVSDYTVFLKDGEIVEFDRTRKIFTDAKEKLTRSYVSSEY